jgi:hypothetical protein
LFVRPSATRAHAAASRGSVAPTAATILRAAAGRLPAGSNCARGWARLARAPELNDTTTTKRLFVLVLCGPRALWRPVSAPLTSSAVLLSSLPLLFSFSLCLSPASISETWRPSLAADAQNAGAAVQGPPNGAAVQGPPNGSRAGAAQRGRYGADGAEGRLPSISCVIRARAAPGARACSTWATRATSTL